VKSAIAGVTILLWFVRSPPASPAEGGAPARFFFIQLSDPQFGFFEDNKGFSRESANLEKVVEQVNRLKPAFVVVTGDLVNLPGDAAQAAEYLRIMKRVDPKIPIHSVPGNHDVDNVPTPGSIDWFRRTFGPDHGSFSVQGCSFLYLNSGLLVHPEKCPKEAEEQLRWFQAEIKRARSEKPLHFILFQHHPWYVGSPVEPDDYHNIPAARRKGCLDLLAKAGARATFAGHLHRSAEGRRTGAMEMVASGPVGKPLGADPSGLRVVWVFDDHLEHRYYGLEAVPAEVRTSGPHDRKF